MQVAKYWKKEGGKIRCTLCPNMCLLQNVEWGG